MPVSVIFVGLLSQPALIATSIVMRAPARIVLPGKGKAIRLIIRAFTNTTPQ